MNVFECAKTEKINCKKKKMGDGMDPACNLYVLAGCFPMVGGWLVLF